MIHIVYLDRATLNTTLHTPNLAHHWSDYPGTTPDEVVPRLKDAQIAITNKVAMTKEMIDQLPKLKLIAVSATGYNHIDIAACRTKDITVCNIQAYATDAVAEHTMMLILALRRNLPTYLTDMLNNRWETSEVFFLDSAPIHDIQGTTLAIIGGGAIGSRVAELARAFRMRVLLTERKSASHTRPGYTPFVEAIQQADIISLHAPMNTDTISTIGKDEFAMMKSTALLINTARGELVDEMALLHALKNKLIAGAALDVIEGPEPPYANKPILHAHLPNLIITPHIAWNSKEAVAALAKQLIDNIEHFFAGTPKNVVS